MSVNLVRASKVGGARHSILKAEEAPEVGMGFETWKLQPGETVQIESEDRETAVLAFHGQGWLESGGRSLEFDRTEWIESAPTVLHCCAGQKIRARNEGSGPAEIFILQTGNQKFFQTRYYSPSDVQIEHRGKGILDDTCYRIVRLVFDDTNGPPESNLVLGEVINFAGRWSSYPPHHHPQPEIYYYRFDPPNGYGHGELGEEVFKVRSGDLLAITDDRSHCQVSAPGYHMYYLWAVRHPEGSRYKGFTFEPEHAWTLQGRKSK